LSFKRNPEYAELARRFAAAFISHNQGVSIATGYKNLPDEDVGGLWYALAEIATRAVAQGNANLIAFLTNPPDANAKIQ
jgi:hypothetical protein